jgi:IclR family transcriptional regulator, mhp operon transcriptional activator
MPSFSPVIALTRGLAVLRAVNEQRQATVRGIHVATGLDKATIVRMLETLEHEGYVMRATDQPVYMATGRTLLLCQGYDRHLWIGSVAEPVLGAFRQRIGWPSDVALCDRDAMVVVQTSRGQGPLSFNRRPGGYRAPVLLTSLGRAYLAFSPPEERQAIIARLAAIPGSDTELARHPRKLKAILDETRERGFAMMDPIYSAREFGDSVWAIGVPVQSDSEVFCAINLMMLSSAVDLDVARAKLVGPLQDAARALAEALSARRPAMQAPEARG